MSEYILFHTLGCHLCEDAEIILNTLSVSFKKIDIADDDALLESYGIYIPVLLEASSASELHWPFDVTTLETFIQTNQ
ncbi:MAG: glutaredoxin family protein [Pseudomonadales bacterium]|nr:glutaredoxin family protein [Pseudomonadales bacterium]